MIPNARKFQPGKSGNPGGRPKGIAAKAREHTDQAMQVLVDGMSDDDHKVRIAAAREVLDRGWGKPVTMTADVTKKLDDLGDDELDAAIDSIRATLAAAAEVGDGAAKTTKH